MSRKLSHFLIAAALSAIVCALVFLPDWSEDPVKLAPGSWQGTIFKQTIQAEVSATEVTWQSLGDHGKATYTWEQTKKEPYRVSFVYNGHKIGADVIFNGEDEAELVLDIKELFPRDQQKMLRSINKSHQRPEDEFKLIFHRVKEK